MAVNPVHNSKFDNITFAGTSFAGAQSNEDYISISPLEDLVEDSIDASGGVVSYAMKNDMRADVTIKIERQSPLNSVLANIVKTQIDGNLLVVDSISFSNSSTLHIYDLEDCVIKRLPDESTTSGVEGNSYEWLFRCGRVVPRRVDQFDFAAEITANLTGALNLSLSAAISI